MVGIQREPEKPILFVHVDDLKLCPGSHDISWAPGVPIAKSLCASTVAFRLGSRVSDTTPDPSVDVSDGEETNDYRNLDYQDCRFHSVAHLMCYRYAIVNGQKTFATGIQKCTAFPTPKFTTLDWVQQWHSLLVDIYSHLCSTDTTVKSALIDTGPQPFTLECLSPWRRVLVDPDISSRTDMIREVLVNARISAAADRLTHCQWLQRTKESRPGTRRARRSSWARVKMR